MREPATLSDKRGRLRVFVPRPLSGHRAVLPKGRSQCAQCSARLGIGERRVQHDLGRRQARQPEAFADFDGAGRSKATGKDGHGETGGDGCRHRRRAATEEHFRPGDASLVESAGRDIAHATGRRQGRQPQRLALPMLEIRRGEPSEMFGAEDLAIASVVFATNDTGVQLSTIEGVEQRARILQADLDAQARIMRVELRQKGRKLRSGHMCGDAEPEAAWGGGSERRQRRFVRGKKVASPVEKDGAVCGKPDMARRALDQALADPLFQAPQLDADRPLRCAKGLRRSRETLKVGDGHEGLDRLDIEGCHSDHPDLLSLKYSAISFLYRQVSPTIRPINNARSQDCRATPALAAVGERPRARRRVSSALKGLIMSFASSRQGNLALAAICLSALMFGFEISSVPAVLPTLETVLRADFQELQWTMNAYTIAVATVLMAAGTLADRFGRKRLLVIAIVAFGGTSLLCGLAPNMTILIAGRALQGASGGAMLICGIAVLSHQFSTAADRARAFGWWGIVTGFGLGFGPVIGSGIAALMGWAWVFLIHGFIAVLTVALAWSAIRESKDPEARRLDLAGIATLSLAVFCVAYVITQGGELGFTSPIALAIIATAALSLIAFIVIEQIAPHPMFDFSVFRIRPFSGALFGSMGMNFSFWPFMIYLPIWFQAGLGLDGLTAGLALLAYTLPALVVPPYAERLSLRLGAGTVIPAGLFVIGLGFFIMKLGTGGGSLALATTLIGALLAGIGLGATNTPVTNTTTGSVSSDRAGMASGIDMSARMISLAINIALMGFVLVDGVLKRLSAVSGSFDATQLRHVAEQVAAGNVGALDQAAPGMSKVLGPAALAGGFGEVMLYGAIGVWVLAALSFFTFGRRRDAHAAR